MECLQIRNQQSRKDYEEQQATSKTFLNRTEPMEDVRMTKVTIKPRSNAADIESKERAPKSDVRAIDNVIRAVSEKSDPTAVTNVVRSDRMPQRKHRHVRPGFEAYKPPHTRQEK